VTKVDAGFDELGKDRCGHVFVEGCLSSARCLKSAQPGEADPVERAGC
jgi:hypothetical protein